MRNQSSMSISNKQNRPTLQRRLSLKHNCASISNSNSKTTMRMSIPTRRQSIATTSVISMFNMHNNNNSNANNEPIKQTRESFASCMSVQLPRTAKKDIILTNLMKKLDHEEELKEIIQSKIRYGKDYEVHYCYDRNTEDVQQKLKNCEKQLECFKDMVRSLMDKISHMEKEPRRPKLSQTVGTQTQMVGHYKTESSFDFMENLDKTLKVLSGKKTK